MHGWGRLVKSNIRGGKKTRSEELEYRTSKQKKGQEKSSDRQLLRGVENRRGKKKKKKEKGSGRKNTFPKPDSGRSGGGETGQQPKAIDRKRSARVGETYRQKAGKNTSRKHWTYPRTSKRRKRRGRVREFQHVPRKKFRESKRKNIVEKESGKLKAWLSHR